MARVLAAMSGGVDSSVATAMAVADGHDVVGVTLKQWQYPDEETRLVKGCCTLDAVDDARRTADRLGIPHYTFDFRDVFEREVVEPFVEDYAAGLTPNPCVRCNQRVRFGALLDKAEALGFDLLVTGHYAHAEDGRLYRAACTDKDQSYVLHALGADVLRRVWFPLGRIDSKAQVRAKARELDLRNWDRDDSVDVCFVDEGQRPGDVVALRRPGAVTPGPIIDADGRTVGEHRGLAYYTIGQRRGLGAVTPGRASYVTTIDRDRNALIVGSNADLAATTLEAMDARFISGRPPADGARVSALTRYRAAEVAATFTSTPDGFLLEFDDPVRAIAPGQAAVIYDGDEVLGGGTVHRSV